MRYLSQTITIRTRPTNSVNIIKITILCLSIFLRMQLISYNLSIWLSFNLTNTSIRRRWTKSYILTQLNTIKSTSYINTKKLTVLHSNHQQSSMHGAKRGWFLITLKSYYVSFKTLVHLPPSLLRILHLHNLSLFLRLLSHLGKFMKSERLSIVFSTI